MGFVDWGDRLDDRLLGRWGRPYESLQSGDDGVEAWWSRLSAADRRNFVVDLNKGVVPTEPVRARAAVAMFELRLRRYWLMYAGPVVAAIVLMVVLHLAGGTWFIGISPLFMVPAFAIGRLQLERQLNTTRAIADLASRPSSEVTESEDA